MTCRSSCHSLHFPHCLQGTFMHCDSRFYCSMWTQHTAAVKRDQAESCEVNKHHDWAGCCLAVVWAADTKNTHSLPTLRMNEGFYRNIQNTRLEAECNTFEALIFTSLLNLSNWECHKNDSWGFLSVVMALLAWGYFRLLFFSWLGIRMCCTSMWPPQTPYSHLPVINDRVPEYPSEQNRAGGVNKAHWDGRVLT